MVETRDRLKNSIESDALISQNTKTQFGLVDISISDKGDRKPARHQDRTAVTARRGFKKTLAAVANITIKLISLSNTIDI